MANSGDKCPLCEGHIQVVNTRPAPEGRVQYLGCRGCGYRPEENKRVVRLEIVRLNFSRQCYQ